MIEWLQWDNMKEWVIYTGFVSVRRGSKSRSRDPCVKNMMVQLSKSKKVKMLKVKSKTSTLSLHAFCPHSSLPCCLFPSCYISYVTSSRCFCCALSDMHWEVEISLANLAGQRAMTQNKNDLLFPSNARKLQWQACFENGRRRKYRYLS